MLRKNPEICTGTSSQSQEQCILWHARGARDVGSGQQRGQPSLGSQVDAASRCSRMLDLRSWASCSASLSPSFLLCKKWRWGASLLNVVIISQCLTQRKHLINHERRTPMLTAVSGLGSHRIRWFLGSNRWDLSSKLSHWLLSDQITYAGDRPGFKCNVHHVRWAWTKSFP